MAAGLALSSVGCMTTYDAYGRPVQSVDPGVAVAGMAAAGLIGAAIANDNDHYHGHYHGGYYYAPPPRNYGGRAYNGYRRGRR